MIICKRDFVIGHDELEVFDRRLEALCREIQPAEAAMDLFIATHELLINSIAEMRRGGEVEGQTICVQIERTPDYLEAIVTDGGRGIHHRPQPEEDPNERLLEAGRGLMMVELLTDTFEVKVNNDGRMSYIIRKCI